MQLEPNTLPVLRENIKVKFPFILLFIFFRQLEEDYIQLATQVERRSSGSSDQVGASGLPLCPVCTKTEIDVKALAPGQLPAVCVDCKKTTCPSCGAFAPPLPNKVRRHVPVTLSHCLIICCCGSNPCQNSNNT